MERMEARSRSTVLVLGVVVAAVVASACSLNDPSGDKAGGAGVPVVLRMAITGSSLDYTPAIAYFVSRVEELSGGNLRIEVANEWGGFSADAEQQVVRDVAGGKVDLGSAGTRVFENLGVEGFAALQAPLLIDSYALEDAVVTSGIPGQMLAGLDRVGVEGLGVFADALQKPIGVDGPLVEPSDWRGITFGMYPSQTQEAAIRSLGATPMEVFGPNRDRALRDGDVQGFELDLLGYQINALESIAPYVTANVNLWPQMDAIFADPDRLAALTDEERGWLEQAASDAGSRSAELADRDQDLVATMCDSGSRFATASQGDLAALRDAFAAVYSTLEQNAQTKGFIDLIEQLKASTEAEPALAIPAGCTGKAPEPAVSGATAALNGIYRWTLSKEDALADDSESHSAEHLAAFPWVFTMKMQDGTWNLSHKEHGELWTDAENETFALGGDRISFAWHSSLLTFRFSTDEAGNLHLEPVEPMNAGDQFVWATHDWTKIAGPRPPVSTSDLAGTYRYVITKQDAIEDGLPGQDLSQYPLVATVILDPDGTWHRGEDTGSYTVSADRVAFDWPRVGYMLTFTFIADDEGDLDMTPVLPMDAGDQFIWATTEWIKIA